MHSEPAAAEFAPAPGADPVGGSPAGSSGPAFIDDDELDTVPVAVITAEVAAAFELARAESAAEADLSGESAARAEPAAPTEPAAPAEPAAPTEPDAVLLAARDQARAALAEITDAVSIGGDAGHEVHEAHVLTLYFTCTLPGYPGWRWAATLARVDDHSAVNVLEVELLPGEGSLTAPDWLPWSERLAQYQDAQAVEAESGTDGDDEDDDGDDPDSDDPDSDILVNDFSDFDDELDGVEVDGDDVGEDDADEDDADEDDDSDDEEE